MVVWLTSAAAVGEASAAPPTPVWSSTLTAAQTAPATAASTATSTAEPSKIPEASAAMPGSLAAYLALARARNPTAEAARERWTASILAIGRSRRWPEPMVGLGVSQPLEVGAHPRVSRVGVEQRIPWPRKLGTRTAVERARAEATRHRALAEQLRVEEQVSLAYWDLWEVRRTRATHIEHLEVLGSLSETIGARIAAGRATLASKQQVDVALARLRDTVSGLDEVEQTAIARLFAWVGVEPGGTEPGGTEPGGTGLAGSEPAGSQREFRGADAWAIFAPTLDDPELPNSGGEGPHALRERVRASPELSALRAETAALGAQVRTEEAERAPDFTLGLEWMRARGATPAGAVPANSGGGAPHDADEIVFGLGMSLPIWRTSYAEAIDAARAELRAQRATARARYQRRLAELEAVLSEVRDSERRLRLYERSLIPQAEAAYESVLGAYASGLGALSDTLLAQSDLLDIRIDRDSARADRARARARLRRLTGAPGAALAPEAPGHLTPRAAARHSLETRAFEAQPPENSP